MAQSGNNGRHGSGGRSTTRSVNTSGIAPTDAVRGRSHSSPADLTDARFEPLDVRAITEMFGFDQSVWPGWALQWARDWEASTSNAPIEPWCKAHHQTRGYQDWQAPSLWATGWAVVG